ncbi:ABC transporter permease [Mesorhizobium sp. M2A.F.Ca.ET.037.01.1.1]|uniref:ABC transporter permease n=1 Tax=unclassified Mesorhizobium TaxID=325217 RepID=UPI000FCC4F43|nr:MULTISPECIES: ABC transporter permease [unclassified Mesorhizobium]RUX10063.1 ABC transporter permease [Mesorhizobium sp. M2A.F.Ca.ET.037.01.1.1]RUY08662.1 ABC transporter permease [Mesorhizobium sp. M2A.F.Ca.ET.040.01.1.1]RWA91596.1 MAG: ABC transporter permease [Mesorhizobium sp.]
MSDAATTGRWTVLRRETGRALGAAFIALAVAFLIILFTSKAPLQAFATLITAPITRVRTVGLWIDDVAKLTVAGLAYSLVFQARQFALGVQGQVYVGALAASYIALSPLGQTWCAIPLGVVCAVAAGALWGFLPGIAKARLGANEIVSSLMLNYVAIELANYLIRVDLTTPNSRLLSTAPFPSTAVFPALIPNTRIDIGLIFALTSVAAVWFALYRTSWGLKLRLVGHNSRFAQYAGIKEAFIIVSAMAASGALGGLLGAMFVEGRSFGKLAVSFEGNLAFEGLLITIIARNRPLAVPVAALFYGYLRQGAQLMSIRTDVPSEIIVIVTAVIILLVASSYSVLPRAMLAAITRSGRPARTHAEAVK